MLYPKGVLKMPILIPSKNPDREKYLRDMGMARWGHNNVPNPVGIICPSKEKAKLLNNQKSKEKLD